jgi:hypothetical protein
MQDFNNKEVDIALSLVKIGKATGVDGVLP